MRKTATIEEKLSHLQEQAEEAAYLYMKTKKELNEQKKFSILNDFVDFNASLTLPFICPLIVKMNAIDFLIKNSNDLKRKLTIIELIEFSDKLSLLNISGMNPKNFDEFKKININSRKG